MAIYLHGESTNHESLLTYIISLLYNLKTFWFTQFLVGGQVSLNQLDAAPAHPTFFQELLNVEYVKYDLPYLK